MAPSRVSQKVETFSKAVASLTAALASPVEEPRDVAGIIQNFEFCYELAWKALKAHLESSGLACGVPKDVFAKAYQSGIIDAEDVWLEIIADRNLTVHTYNEALAEAMVERIRSRYAPEFVRVLGRLQAAS